MFHVSNRSSEIDWQEERVGGKRDTKPRWFYHGIQPQFDHRGMTWLAFADRFKKEREKERPWHDE